jgi:ankyrin repeat protein
MDYYETIKYPSILYYAAITGKYDDVVKLIDLGYDVNEPAENGTTPLFGAYVQNHTNIVKLLEDAGADRFHITDDITNITKLHVACYYNDIKMVEHMLRNDVDIYDRFSIYCFRYDGDDSGPSRLYDVSQSSTNLYDDSMVCLYCAIDIAADRKHNEIITLLKIWKYKKKFSQYRIYWFIYKCICRRLLLKVSNNVLTRYNCNDIIRFVC